MNPIDTIDTIEHISQIRDQVSNINKYMNIPCLDTKIFKEHQIKHIIETMERMIVDNVYKFDNEQKEDWDKFIADTEYKMFKKSIDKLFNTRPKDKNEYKKALEIAGDNVEYKEYVNFEYARK